MGNGILSLKENIARIIDQFAENKTVLDMYKGSLHFCCCCCGLRLRSVGANDRVTEKEREGERVREP